MFSTLYPLSKSLTHTGDGPALCAALADRAMLSRRLVSVAGATLRGSSRTSALKRRRRPWSGSEMNVFFALAGAAMPEPDVSV